MGRFIPNENTYVGFTLGPIGPMAPPAGVTATTGAPGTIPVGAQSYKITAFNETGETAGSTAASASIAGSPGGITLSWSAVPGAEGYRIYGRAAGSPKLLAQVGQVTTFIDSGAVAPQTAVPPVVGTASNYSAPSVADVNGAVELTEYVSGLNFTAQGNTVPTPNLRRLFETSIEGTSQATATMDCYRDDAIDTAWQVLPRKTKGFVILARNGGNPNSAGDKCEVWPVRVSSRSNSNMTNNTPVAFTVTFAVTQDPAEDAVTVA